MAHHVKVVPSGGGGLESEVGRQWGNANMPLQLVALVLCGRARATVGVPAPSCVSSPLIPTPPSPPPSPGKEAHVVTPAGGVGRGVEGDGGQEGGPRLGGQSHRRHSPCSTVATPASWPAGPRTAQAPGKGAPAPAGALQPLKSGCTLLRQRRPEVWHPLPGAAPLRSLHACTPRPSSLRTWIPLPGSRSAAGYARDRWQLLMAACRRGNRIPRVVSS